MTFDTFSSGLNRLRFYLTPFGFVLLKQVLNAVSIAPVQMQATPIVSIASIAQPQQIITSSTPLAIAANTSQGQQLQLSTTQGQLALASTQQAGQILGTSQITLATGNYRLINTYKPKICAHMHKF